MARPMNLTIVRDPAHLDTDRIELRVAGVVQGDLIRPWDPGIRSHFGFGAGVPEFTPFGGLPPQAALSPAGVLFGAGVFGVGAGALDHETLAAFVAGDYACAVRAIDAQGNASDWSEDVTVEHRPIPPSPDITGVAAGVLAWTWSDP